MSSLNTYFLDAYHAQATFVENGADQWTWWEDSCIYDACILVNLVPRQLWKDFLLLVTDNQTNTPTKCWNSKHLLGLQ